MAALSRNVYINILDDIVDKSNYAYHRIIQMKRIEVKCRYIS